MTYALVSATYLSYIRNMRTDRQIMAMALRDITNLTDPEYDRYREIQKERQAKTQNKRNGGMIKGYSPISRPQRFKGIF